MENANLLEGWSFDEPVEFEIGETYVVTATHDRGFWASMLIIIIDCVDGNYEFRLETLLDGSEGLVDGYDNAPNYGSRAVPGMD